MRGGFRIFDTHTHIGAARHSGRRYTAEQLLADMDRHGIERSMVIPFPVVEDERAAHDEIGRAVQAWPDRFAGAACMYPYVDEQKFRDEARRCREVYGFKALKLQPQYQPLNTLWPTSEFFFETAADNDFTVIVHTGTGIPYSLPAMYILPAQKHPELRIVLAHCGGGGILSGEAIVAALLCPNIYLELSCLMPHNITEVLNHVRADRLMVGSDLPESAEIEIDKVVRMAIPDEQKREMLYGTGCRVYGSGC